MGASHTHAKKSMTIKAPIVPAEKSSPIRTETLSRWLDYGMKIQLASLLVSIAVAQILVGFLGILWIILMARGRRYTRTPLDIPLFIFIAVRSLAVFFSEFPAESFSTFSRELVFYISFFFSAHYLQQASREQVIGTLRWLFVSTAVVAFLSTFQVIFGMVERANGFTGGGTMATHLVFVLPFLLLSLENKEILKSRWVVWILLATVGMGLAFSTKRGDWLAAGAIVFLYGLIFNRRLLLGALLFGAVVVALVPEVQERLLTLAAPMENASDRLPVWEAAAQRFGEHPILGFGPRTFRSVFQDVDKLTDKGISSWHNETIQIYMESGALGLASFFFLIGFLVFLSVRLIRSKVAGLHGFRPGWAGVLLVMGLLIVGLFGTPAVSITNAMLFRFLMALIAVEFMRMPKAQTQEGQ